MTIINSITVVSPPAVKRQPVPDPMAEWEAECKNVLTRLNFPEGFDIQVIQPVSGALVKFNVLYKGRSVTVRFYRNSEPSAAYEPYWEADSIDGFTQRFLLSMTHDLVRAIVSELRPSWWQRFYRWCCA